MTLLSKFDKYIVPDSKRSWLTLFFGLSMIILSMYLGHYDNVEIGDGTWIGENVCIIGASIGKQCVIGANSVVLKDIPDYCVAVGLPAKVIKKYNFEASSQQV